MRLPSGMSSVLKIMLFFVVRWRALPLVYVPKSTFIRGYRNQEYRRYEENVGMPVGGIVRIDRYPR